MRRSPRGSSVVRVTLGAALFACNGGGPGGLAAVPCGEVSTCPNDPTPTQSDTDTCIAEIASACGSAYQAYHDCYGDDRVCAFNGTTDVIATQRACTSEANAVASCLASAAPDGGIDASF